MHSFSSLVSYYTALVDGDLLEVEKWSLCLGINTRFSNGKIMSRHLPLNFCTFLTFSSLR